MACIDDMVVGHTMLSASRLDAPQRLVDVATLSPLGVHPRFQGRGVGTELVARIPDEAFQVSILSAYEPWMTGTLVYSESFWALDCVGLRDPAVS